MWSHRARIVVMVAVGSLVSAVAAQAQEKRQASPHIQTALTFLTAWGNQRWDELKTVAAVQVTVKVGDKAFTLEPAAQKAEVALVFPFRGLSTVRQDDKVKGVTVEELGLKVDDSETRGPGSITLKEQDGQYWVTEVSTGQARRGERKKRERIGSREPLPLRPPDPGGGPGRVRSAPSGRAPKAPAWRAATAHSQPLLPTRRQSWARLTALRRVRQDSQRKRTSSSTPLYQRAFWRIIPSVVSGMSTSSSSGSARIRIPRAPRA